MKNKRIIGIVLLIAFVLSGSALLINIAGALVFFVAIGIAAVIAIIIAAIVWLLTSK
jgi:hypothetical protein